MPICIVCDTQVDAQGSVNGALLRCPACDFVFAQVQPSADEHLSLYQRDYFFGDEYVDYMRSKPALQANFRRWIDLLSRFSDGGRLYEIGSAYGFFLEMAQARWQVEGIDIAREGCVYARDKLHLNVQCGDFLEVALEGDAYDLFCMWDTIEHLREPHRYVAKVARYLRPGGHLALTTGDVGSWSARLQGRRWRLIHPPTHLHYFSVPTLTRLLDRHGLDVVHVSHPGFYRSVESMSHWFFSLFGRRGKGLYRGLQDRAWMQAAVYLNLFDIIFVVARKR